MASLSVGNWRFRKTSSGDPTSTSTAAGVVGVLSSPHGCTTWPSCTLYTNGCAPSLYTRQLDVSIAMLCAGCALLPSKLHAR